MSWTFVLILVAGFFALYGLHRLALWAESKGWIYYRTKRMPPGAAGMAMMEVNQIFEPKVEHVLEEMRSENIRAEETESGEESDREAGRVRVAERAGHPHLHPGRLLPHLWRDCEVKGNPRGSEVLTGVLRHS